MSTKIVRLTSGEEIICSYSEKDGMCELKKPAIIIPTGQGQLGLMPWLGYADLGGKPVEIDSKFIVFVVDAQNDLLNEYNSAFGSGLFVPASPVAQGPQGSGTALAGDNSLKLTT